MAEAINKPSFMSRLAVTISTRFQKAMDDVMPFPVLRWTCFLLTLVCYLVRTFLLKGWYIVTYALGIYLLNLLIAFLSPKIDPAMAQFEEEEQEEDLALPSKNSDEFKPFVRRLPEFKFWFRGQRAVLLSFGATFFEAFNVPVFWPILVMYFFILFGISMKQRIKHMLKYNYVPMDIGKPKFKGKEDSGKVVST
eukprot:m.338268 g.338268  ORF g.338268 m.338268 type:complete len:194 (+) comp18363_c0_seq1:182-763(+)